MSAMKPFVLSLFLGTSALVGNPSWIAAQKPEATSEPKAVTVVVDNQSYLDMRVYVVQGGIRWNLGVADATSEESFVLPSLFSGMNVRVLAEPEYLPRTYYLSSLITPGRGEQVKVWLYNDARFSWTTVENPSSPEEPSERDEGPLGHPRS